MASLAGTDEESRAMLYLIIESFRNRDAVPVYRSVSFAKTARPAGTDLSFQTRADHDRLSREEIRV